MKNRNAYTIGALIGLCFLLKGSEYISWWLYGLPRFFGNTAVDLLSEGAGYLLQVAGILLLGVIVKKRTDLAMSHRFFAGLIMIDVAAAGLAIFAPAPSLSILFGMIMNLLLGAIAGYYLTYLAQYVPQQKRGMTFGLAYAFGSLGSWLLSLLGNGSFLGSPYILLVYAGIAALIIWLNQKWVPSLCQDDSPAQAFHFSEKILPLAGVLVILLSLTKGMGFYFPISDLTNGLNEALFTRAFYAFGLILAGYINDQNRKYGAICCLCALVFPFISFAVSRQNSIGFLMWILAYVFFGFFSVYRAVIFVDFAQK